jgi:hypothetical protein
MKEHNEKKEPKTFVTRMSHKIQKTLGVVTSKNDVLDDLPTETLQLKPVPLETLQLHIHSETLPLEPEKEKEKDKDKEKETLSQIFEPTVNKLSRSTKMADLFASDEECKEDEEDEDSCKEVHFKEVQIVKITGCVGPTGPPGPTAKPFSNTFICVNRATEQLLAKDDAIIWTSNTIKVGDINNVVNASGIYIWRPGYYMVYYNLCHKQPCKFSLFKNGVLVDGSTITSSINSLQNSSFVIVRIDSTDFTSLSPSGLAAKLEVVNHTPTVQNNHIVALTGVASMNVVLLFETTQL